MKLKYYLRGLGIGIIVSSLIFTISGTTKTADLSDEEIIERAQELGMVTEEQQESENEDVSEDSSDTSTESSAEAQTDETTQEAETFNTQDTSEGDSTDASAEEAAQDTSSDTADVQSQTDESGNTEASNEETTGTQTSEEVVSIKVSGGEYSDKVCQKLKKAGLIDDADSFNQYLISNNYDSMIHTGTYKIPVGSSNEEIAAILTADQ